METRVVHFSGTSTPEPTLLELGRPHRITLVLQPKNVDIIEIGDTHFRLNSGVFLPNSTEDANNENNESVFSPGITLIERTLRYIELTGKNLLIAGHTDTVGSNANNVILSEVRVDCVKAILLGDRELFGTTANAPHITDKDKKANTLFKDKLQICDWVAAEFGLKCSQKANSFDFIKTFKAFQSEYNDFGFPGATPLKVDGDWGPLSWKAAFDFYQLKLADRLLLSKDQLDAYRQRIGLTSHLLGGSKQRVACGEFQPIENPEQNDFQSNTNRRVEFLFFNPSEKVDPPCLNGPCAEKDCPLFASLKEARGQIASARWSDPLIIAGASELRELILESPQVKSGEPVEFSIFLLIDGDDKPKKIGMAEDVEVVAGKAKAFFNELHEDVLKQFPTAIPKRFSYFFMAKGIRFEINSARLHADRDHILFQ